MDSGVLRIDKLYIRANRAVRERHAHFTEGHLGLSITINRAQIFKV